MNTTSCNYEPLATVPCTDCCIAFGNPNCPDGPDLTMDQARLHSTLSLSTVNITDARVILRPKNGMLSPSLESSNFANAALQKSNDCLSRATSLSFASVAVSFAAAGAVAVLIGQLEGGDALAREKALRVVELIGPTAAGAVTALVRLLGNEDPSTRGAAAWALGKIGPAAAAAVDTLIERLGDDDAWVRSGAARGLEGIGPAAAAGLQRGDVVTAFNGRPIPDSRELARAVASAKPGSVLPADIIRDGHDSKVNLRIVEMSDS